MKHFDFFFKVCFLTAALLFITRFSQQQTDNFTLLGILPNHPYDSNYETTPLDVEEKKTLFHALDQSYTYLRKGGQAYAFISEDGNYVIKFFKQRLYQTSTLLNFLPLPKFLYHYRYKHNFKRKDKLRRDFFSYKIAFEELKEETGILYAHLNPTDHLKKTLEIVDKIGIHHSLDLDQIDFIVQKQADSPYWAIDQMIRQGHMQQAKIAIGHILDLISSRAKKGFYDRDPDIETNCGLLQNRAIKIDVGSFVRNPMMETKKGHNEEILRVTAPFEKWIQDFHPELMLPFKQQLNEVLRS